MSSLERLKKTAVVYQKTSCEANLLKQAVGRRTNGCRASSRRANGRLPNGQEIDGRNPYYLSSPEEVAAIRGPFRVFLGQAWEMLVRETLRQRAIPSMPGR